MTLTQTSWVGWKWITYVNDSSLSIKRKKKTQQKGKSPCSASKMRSILQAITCHNILSYIPLLQVSLYNFSSSNFQSIMALFILVQNYPSHQYVYRPTLDMIKPSQLMLTHLLLNRCHPNLLSDILVSNFTQPCMATYPS